eukprot:9911839-Lingulodinium_polyedra.AAC.1
MLPCGPPSVLDDVVTTLVESGAAAVHGRGAVLAQGQEEEHQPFLQALADKGYLEWLPNGQIVFTAAGATKIRTAWVASRPVPFFQQHADAQPCPRECT